MQHVIGGYLELELRNNPFPYSDSLLLNTGRNCFEYILRAGKTKKVYMPNYTCAVMLEPLEKLNINWEFYQIGSQFEILDDITPQDDELIVYTNYFGVRNDYSRQIAERFGSKLVLDLSQAFFSPAAERGHSFYSPRKFFALPDGGCLITPLRLSEDFPVDTSSDKMDHLLKRIDLGAEAEFEAYIGADPRMKQQPIRQMSRLTRALMGNIDYQAAQETRLANFRQLHAALSGTNLLHIDNDDLTGPYMYPYLIDNSEALRQKLLANGVLFARYWRSVLEWCQPEEPAHYLARNIIPLPISQNYGAADMARIIELIERES